MKLEDSDPYSPPVKRGVYRPRANFPGVVRWEVVDSSGDLMMEVKCRADVASDAFERALRRMLAKQDTGIKLRVVS